MDVGLLICVMMADTFVSGWCIASGRALKREVTMYRSACEGVMDDLQVCTEKLDRANELLAAKDGRHD